MTTLTYTRKDFQSDQEVKWCPGCGDFTILASVQNLFAEIGLPREKFVIVSGIGCSSRFPYYMDTYGMHGIHGRAPAIATGIAITRPDLSVWVMTGDGDALSIGGNHIIHAMRRNVNINVVVFNNQIYGLTKGQYSPTSEEGKITKSSPWGSIDHPFNPVSLALGAEASYVARSIDMDRELTERVLREAYEHRGASFIEIYQNCNVFNNHAFLELTGKDTRDQNRINLVHGEPIVFGPEGENAVIMENGAAKVVPTASVDPSQIIVHDEFAVNPSVAFSLSRLSHGPHGPTPVGVFRNAERTVYETVLQEQIDTVQKKKGVGDIETLVRSQGTWTVE